MTSAGVSCRYCWYCHKLKRRGEYQCKNPESVRYFKIVRLAWCCRNFADKKTFLKGN